MEIGKTTMTLGLTVATGLGLCDSFTVGDPITHMDQLAETVPSAVRWGIAAIPTVGALVAGLRGEEVTLVEPGIYGGTLRGSYNIGSVSPLYRSGDLLTFMRRHYLYSAIMPFYFYMAGHGLPILYEYLTK